ncbi:MAG: rhomboid family intramembrane serine protease [Planctomycetaceae bacterium]|jgi:membrane associated rhomboid family serine protease|nr:rhomboid family intramembrane serine protease [Planctomycetaceae bacterium]
MFFPYNTDAPLYYRPIVTILMIAVNFFAFFCELADPEFVVTFFALKVGDGLNPIQWLTCNFLHADIFHLVGNMISFWAFGLVVEGKLGLFKTLGVYLGIGTIYGAIVQILMLGGDEGICLGASAIVFGMMAMCIIWAPENSMECVLFIRITPIFFEVRIKILVCIFLVMQIIFLVLNGGRLSSEFLHVVGAVTGFIVGIWLLKSGQVDCENWDIFSIWSGRHEMTEIERIKHDANTPKAKQKKIEQSKKRQNLLLEEIRIAINDNNPIPAFVIVQKMIKEFPNAVIPESDLLSLIQILIKGKLWSEAIVMIREYLSRFTSKSLPIRLNLARIFIEIDKPHSAKKTLSKIDPNDLDSSQYKVLQSLKELAQKKALFLEQQGIYEVVEEV